MRKRPHLRLISSSSSVSEMPRSRAQRSNGKCQRPGIQPRLSHMKTALGVKSDGKADAIASRPPSLAMMAETGAGAVSVANIGTDCATAFRPPQEQKVPVRANFMFQLLDEATRPRRNRLMADHLLTEEQWKLEVFKRLKRLLDDVGIDENEFANEMCEHLGISAKAVKQQFNRQSLPAYAIFKFCKVFGIRVSYLMCESDSKGAAVIPGRRYARELERIQKIMRLQPTA